MTGRGWRTTLAVLALAFAGGGAARAHGVPYPKRDHLFLTPGLAKLSIVYIVDDEGAERTLRERFDRDGDGALDESEAGAASRLLVGLARRATTLSVNGQPLAVQITAHTIDGLDGPRADEHLAVVLVLEAPLPAAGTFRLEIGDHGRTGKSEVPLAVTIAGLELKAVARGRLVTGPTGPTGNPTGERSMEGVMLDREKPWWTDLAIP